jgi:hypothetical protein
MITTTNHPTHWTAHAPALDWTETGPTETLAIQRLRLRAAARLLDVRTQIAHLFEALHDGARDSALSVWATGGQVFVSVGGEVGEGDDLHGALDDLHRSLDAKLSPLLCVAGHVVVAP